MFQVGEYTGTPINNEHDKFDQYRAKRIDSDNIIGFGIEIDGTITDDVQDIMHTFLDVYHLFSIAPFLS